MVVTVCTRCCINTNLELYLVILAEHQNQCPEVLHTSAQNWSSMLVSIVKQHNKCQTLVFCHHCPLRQIAGSVEDTGGVISAIECRKSEVGMQAWMLYQQKIVFKNDGYPAKMLAQIVNNEADMTMEYHFIRLRSIHISYVILHQAFNVKCLSIHRE